MVDTDTLPSAFDVDEMATEALLFQAGYLTITGEDDPGGEPVGRPIHLIGVEFSHEDRNVVAFEVERAAPRPGLRGGAMKPDNPMEAVLLHEPAPRIPP